MGSLRKNVRAFATVTIGPLSTQESCRTILLTIEQKDGFEGSHSPRVSSV